MTPKPKPGEWIASTIGTAIGFLADQTDPAAIWREVHRTEPDEEGKFVARYEVILVPNGMVRATIENLGIEHVHKTLSELAARGLIT